MAAQNELAALSTNSIHELLPNASHSMLTENKGMAARSTRAHQRSRQCSAHQDSPHRKGGLKMNPKTIVRTFAAGIGVTVVLSACGSTTAGRQTTSPVTVRAAGRGYASESGSAVIVAASSRQARSPSEFAPFLRLSPAAHDARYGYPDPATGPGLARRSTSRPRPPPHTGFRPSSCNGPCRERQSMPSPRPARKHAPRSCSCRDGVYPWRSQLHSRKTSRAMAMSS